MAALTSEIPPVSGQPAVQERCILVVDDNPAVLKLIGSLFAEQGIAVRLARSAAEAKRLLTQGTPSFDLVLSDIQMPGESGFDLLEWIKREESPWRALPVLLTTAQLPEAENRLKGLAMGAVDYVVRPIELRELVIRSINAIEHFQRVKSLETALQSSENLAMVGRLMAASAHEVKNLATLVKMSADTLQKLVAATAGRDPRVEQALRSVAESSALLTDVARSVSTLFEVDRVPKRPLRVATVVQEVIGLMAARVRPYRLELVTTDDLWVMGNTLRIKQVLINLILNANDAITELGPDDGGRILVRVSADATGVHVSVVDNGIGLRVPGVRREFVAFATTRRLRGGQGLGLWLCARLLAGMDGHLRLESKGVGTGVAATMTLPAAAAEEDDGLAAEVQRHLADLD